MGACVWVPPCVFVRQCVLSRVVMAGEISWKRRTAETSIGWGKDERGSKLNCHTTCTAIVCAWVCLWVCVSASECVWEMCTIYGCVYLHCAWLYSRQRKILLFTWVFGFLYPLSSSLSLPLCISLSHSSKIYDTAHRILHICTGQINFACDICALR